MDRLLCGVVIAGLLLSVGLPAVQGLAEEEDIMSSEGEIFEDYTPCGGNATNGTIILNPSLNKTVCNITVEAAAGSKYISILFSRLDLKGTDNLTIYDGKDQLLNVTGSRESLVVVVTSPKAFLVVHINADKSGSILQATYNAGCSIRQTVNSTSMLQSPVYLPGKAAFNCSYLVDQTVGTNTRLALSFVEVALPNATLKVTSSGLIVTGTGKLPSDVYSNKIQMLLVVPKVQGPMQNFSAAVSPVIMSSVCGQVKEVSSDYTLNLTVPASPPLSYDCRVTLKAGGSGKSLWMNISSLQLAGPGDSLEIIDGGSLAGNNVLASFTSAKSGYLVLSGQQQVLVRLVLGVLRGGRSLVLDVKKLDKVHHLYNAGNFSIPPSNGSAVVSQYYLMEALPNSTVKFMLSQPKKNTTFNVDVHDGDQPSSPLLVTFSSGRQLAVPAVSSGSRVLVVARLSNASQPLNASFSSQAPGCDKITSAAEGAFHLMTSPRVPPMCRWTMTAPPSSTRTLLLDMTTVKLSKKATVSVYSGVAGSGGSLVARFTNASSLSSAPLPSVAVPALQWAQVVWSSGNSSNLTSVAVNMRFQLRDSLCGGQVQATQGHLRSPAFPNLYPLNTLCQWTFPPSKPGRLLFFDFPQFQLAQNHSVVIVEKRNGTSRQVASFNSSSASLPDVLYASNATNTVTFSARLPKAAVVANQVAQGFDIQYWALNCGGFMNQSKGSFSNPGYPSPIPISPANATLCVWLVQLTRKAGEDPKIVNLTLQFKKTGSPAVADLVKVYDGTTIRQKPIALNISKGLTAHALSRYNTILVVFNISALSSGIKADSPKLAFMLNYTTFSCNKTYQCKNGMCMHPDWRCNGVDDCGDDSDEQNCVSPPTPVHPDTQKGMKPVVVVLLFFVGLLLGVLLAVIVPRIIRRFRTNRYASFRNEPAVA